MNFTIVLADGELSIPFDKLAKVEYFSNMVNWKEGEVWQIDFTSPEYDPKVMRNYFTLLLNPDIDLKIDEIINLIPILNYFCDDLNRIVALLLKRKDPTDLPILASLNYLHVDRWLAHFTLSDFERMPSDELLPALIAQADPKSINIVIHTLNDEEARRWITSIIQESDKIGEYLESLDHLDYGLRNRTIRVISWEILLKLSFDCQEMIVEKYDKLLYRIFLFHPNRFRSGCPVSDFIYRHRQEIVDC